MQEVDFFEHLDELYPLFEAHNAELNHGRVLDLDLDTYKSLNDDGLLYTLIHRVDKDIACFLVGYNMPMIHHKKEQLFMVDSFHVLEKYRKLGLASKMMAHLPFKRVIAAVKVDTTASEFMERAGFELHELTYTKGL